MEWESGSHQLHSLFYLRTCSSHQRALVSFLLKAYRFSQSEPDSVWIVLFRLGANVTAHYSGT